MTRPRRRLLVTGGAGFIGSNFAIYWRTHHPDDPIVVLDALTYAGQRENLSTLEGTTGFDFVLGDINDFELVCGLLNRHEIDTVVHFAAECHVDRSIGGPDAFIVANINGTQALLKAARKCWLDERTVQSHRFHHISTDEVYGSLGPNDPAFREEAPYAPNSPYSASKAASDHLVRAYHHTFGLETTTTNCSNNYGPYQFPEKLIPFFLVNALHGKPLPIYGDGTNVRDWLHVEDHCRGIELVLEQGRCGERYNIGGNHELSNMTVVDMLCAEIDEAFAEEPELALRYPNAPPAMGKSTTNLKTFVTDRPGHDRRYALDTRKIAAELGYCPKYDFKCGLGATIHWYLRNEKWLGSVLDKMAQGGLVTEYSQLWRA